MIRLFRLLGLLFPIRFFISVRVPFILLSSYYLPICLFHYGGIEVPRSSLVETDDSKQRELEQQGQNLSDHDLRNRDRLEAFGDLANSSSWWLEGVERLRQLSSRSLVENLVSDGESFSSNLCCDSFGNLLAGNLSMEEWLGLGVEKFNEELNVFVQDVRGMSSRDTPA